MAAISIMFSGTGAIGYVHTRVECGHTAHHTWGDGVLTKETLTRLDDSI